jgi:hypothetical protein
MKLKSLNYIYTICAIFGILFSAHFLSHEDMVVYGRAKKLDVCQIFFSADGVYSEQFSARGKILNNTRDVGFFKLPKKVDYIRIDPSNYDGNIIISKIEIKYLLGRETYRPENIYRNIKPIQMIRSMEITPEGLLIQSEGNDPALELHLGKLRGYSKILHVTLFSILGTIIILFLVSCFIFTKKYSIAKSVRNTDLNDRNQAFFKKLMYFIFRYKEYFIIIFPIIASICICSIFYPGFMSYDTLHALRGARHGVNDSMWPPMVSYIWRIVDYFWPSTSAMHFVQVSLLLIPFFYLINNHTHSVKYSLFSISLYILTPTVIGTLAVIWKDVLMTSFLFLGYFLGACMATRYSPKRNFLLTLSSLFFIVLAVTVRHNAIFAAFPLFLFVAHSAFKTFYSASLISIKVIASVVVVGLSLSFLSLFVIKKALDCWTLPDFRPLKNPTGDFLVATRILDIAGASICSGENLFGNSGKSLDFEQIKTLYDPRHVNLSANLLAKVDYGMVNPVWFSILYNKPWLLSFNKIQLFKFLVGYNHGSIFCLTHPQIDQNEFGIILPDSSFRDSVLDYIVVSSNFTVTRPYFIYSFCFFVFIWRLFALKKNSDFYLLLSALLYLGSLIVFGNAADARLPFFTTTVAIYIILTASWDVLIKKQIQNDTSSVAKLPS